MSTKPTIAERLRVLRASRNIPHKQTVAQAINKRPNTYADWESGVTEPSASNVALLAEYFGVSSDYLLGLSDHEHGLPSGMYLVDMDVVDNPGYDELAAVKIPRNARVVDHEDYERIRDSLERHGKRKRRKE